MGGLRLQTTPIACVALLYSDVAGWASSHTAHGHTEGSHRHYVMVDHTGHFFALSVLGLGHAAIKATTTLCLMEPSLKLSKCEWSGKVHTATHSPLRPDGACVIESHRFGRVGTHTSSITHPVSYSTRWASSTTHTVTDPCALTLAADDGVPVCAAGGAASPPSGRAATDGPHRGTRAADVANQARGGEAVRKLARLPQPCCLAPVIRNTS